MTTLRGTSTCPGPGLALIPNKVQNDRKYKLGFVFQVYNILFTKTRGLVHRVGRSLNLSCVPRPGLWLEGPPLLPHGLGADTALELPRRCHQRPPTHPPPPLWACHLCQRVRVSLYITLLLHSEARRAGLMALGRGLLCTTFWLFS